MKITNQHKFTLDFSPRLFEKNSADDIIGCDFEISFDHIIKSFSEFYDYSMRNERKLYEYEDDDEDFYIALNKLDFPDLGVLLPKYKSLFFPYMHE